MKVGQNGGCAVKKRYCSAKHVIIKPVEQEKQLKKHRRIKTVREVKNDKNG